MLHLEKKYHFGKLVTKHLHTFLSLKDNFVSDYKSCKIRKVKSLNTFLSFLKHLLMAFR